MPKVGSGKAPQKQVDAPLPEESEWTRKWVTLMLSLYADPNGEETGTLSAEAFVLKPFAVHKTVGNFFKDTDKTYTLSHVPTRRRILMTHHEADARMIAELLRENFAGEFASSERAEIVARVPKHIVDWLLRCNAARQMVDL